MDNTACLQYQYHCLLICINGCCLEVIRRDHTLVFYFFWFYTASQLLWVLSILYNTRVYKWITEKALFNSVFNYSIQFTVVGSGAAVPMSAPSTTTWRIDVDVHVHWQLASLSTTLQMSGRWLSTAVRWSVSMTEATLESGWNGFSGAVVGLKLAAGMLKFFLTMLGYIKTL